MNKQESTTRFSIVPPTEEDAEPMARMHAQSWRDTYPGLQSGLTAEWVEEIAAEKTSVQSIERQKERFRHGRKHPQAQLTLVAKDDKGEIIGFIGAEKDEDKQELGGLYVDKAYQGKGVAQALMERFLDWIDQASSTQIWVTEGNERAVGFYKRNGFNVVEGSRTPWKQDSPMWIVKMVREGVKK